jgi:hypothetical protein
MSTRGRLRDMMQEAMQAPWDQTWHVITTSPPWQLQGFSLCSRGDAWRKASRDTRERRG